MLKDPPQIAFFWLVGRKHTEVQIIVGARDNEIIRILVPRF